MADQKKSKRKSEFLRKLKAEPSNYKIEGQDIKLVVRSPLPKNHEYYNLIGRVASYWTLFEHSLDFIIWDFTKLPNSIALCVTGQMMGATTRFKIIEALGKQAGISHDDLKPVRTLKDRHYTIIEERNRIVHDPWFVVRDTDDGSRMGEVSQLKVTGQTPVNEDEVQETIGRIRGLINEAGELRNYLRDAASALPDK